MSTIIMSIKPVYVEKIFAGIKKYEYRKIMCKQKVDKIIVYASSPVKKIVGELLIEDILFDNKEIIYNKTYKDSGIAKDTFDKYYCSQEYAVAYKIKKVIKYDSLKDLKDYNIKKAPQFFVYLD